MIKRILVRDPKLLSVYCIGLVTVYVYITCVFDVKESLSLLKLLFQW